MHDVCRVAKADKGHDLRTWDVTGLAPCTFVNGSWDISNVDIADLYAKMKQAEFDITDIFDPCW